MIWFIRLNDLFCDLEMKTKSMRSFDLDPGEFEPNTVIGSTSLENKCITGSNRQGEVFDFFHWRLSEFGTF